MTTGSLQGTNAAWPSATTVAHKAVAMTAVVAELGKERSDGEAGWEVDLRTAMAAPRRMRVTTALGRICD
jgi:hypothetical protein